MSTENTLSAILLIAAVFMWVLGSQLGAAAEYVRSLEQQLVEVTRDCNT